jgi:rhamnose utilization protein RhaD (predicted bifunctional aldolase and dehydrogenase)
VHVHCVDTIALAVREDAPAALAKILRGLSWAFVPYRRPGLPLAMGIAEHCELRPDVLVLGNHGLVVAAETVEEAEALLYKVKDLVRQEVRTASPADEQSLAALAGRSYGSPDDPAAHQAATDLTSLTFAAQGSLYPDHVIFLGVSSIVARAGEAADDVATRLGYPPASILFPGLGVLMHTDANPGAHAMARCLADVLARVPAGASLRYLTAEENRALTDWDAEKYRQRLNAASGAA